MTAEDTLDTPTTITKQKAPCFHYGRWLKIHPSVFMNIKFNTKIEKHQLQNFLTRTLKPQVKANLTKMYMYIVARDLFQ